MTSRSVYNLVRALTRPYLGAELKYKGKNAKIWRAAEARLSMPNIEPGKVLGVQGRAVLVKCGCDAVWLKEHDFEKIPSSGEYLG